MAYFVIEKEDCLSAEMVQVVHWSLQLRAIPSSEAEVKVACMELEACRRAILISGNTSITRMPSTRFLVRDVL